VSWNWGTAESGGAAGEQVGQNFGPWGAAAGAAIGTVAGGLALGKSPGTPIPSPLAGMSEEEYNYFQQNIAPLQQQALQNVNGPNATANAVQQAQGQVNTQFQNLPGAFSRQMAGRGIATTPAQQAAFNKSAALQKGMATAGASNQAAANVQAAKQATIGA
jgi:hypothetical protein